MGKQTTHDDEKGEPFSAQLVSSAAPRTTAYELRDRGAKESVPGLLLRVHPSGRKTYYAQIERGVRVRLGVHPVVTLKKARNDAKAVLGKAADGHDYQAERKHRKYLAATTLGGFIDGPWSEYAEGNIATASKIKSAVKLSFADLLKKPMTEIAELDMRRWRKQRGEHRKKNGDLLKQETLKRDLTYLKAILNHAVATKAIPGHQLARFKVAGTLQDAQEATHSTAKLRYLTPAEEKRLRAALDVREGKHRAARLSANAWRRARRRPLMPEISPEEFTDHIKPLVLLALNTGLRRGDLFDLQWHHVDLARRQIRKVIGKSSHARRKAGKPAVAAELPLSPEAHAILAQLKRQRDPDSELVFPSPRAGKDGTRAPGGTRLGNIKNGFAEILKDAKITGFTFHDLRHSFASKLVMAGVDINTVRELMTHSDIKMTLIYAHLSPDHKAKALKKAFGGAA